MEVGLGMVVWMAVGESCATSARWRHPRTVGRAGMSSMTMDRRVRLFHGRDVEVVGSEGGAKGVSWGRSGRVIVNKS